MRNWFLIGLGAGLLAGVMLTLWAVQDVKKRTRDTWDMQTASQQEALAEEVRLRCCQDLKYLYQEVLCHGNPYKQQSLGRIHNLIFDFLRWDELAEMPAYARHSSLWKYLPKPVDGVYPERWIYYPVLAEAPIVADGADNEISAAYHAGDLPAPNMAGVVIRIVDRGRIKSLMLPRGHLKTEIADVALNLQEIVRDPSKRTMVRCGEEMLAERVIGDAKRAFEANGAFAEMFGHLKPETREEVWSKEAMQVRTEIRRGKEPTLSAVGMFSSITGQHCDRVVFDDIVQRENLHRQAAIRDRVQELAFIADAHFEILNLGTPHAEDDAHGLFIRPDGGGYPFCSFMIGCLKDAVGNYIWPEVYNAEVETIKRALVPDDYTWACQMWCNPLLAKAARFDRNWIEYYEDEIPSDLAKRERLDLVLTVDPANSVEKKSDYSAALLQGQTPDATKRYVLDGFRERLGPDQLPGAIADLVSTWLPVAREVRTNFKVGIEDHSFQTYVERALRDELRRRGLSCHIEGLKHRNRKKHDRIWRLAAPYQTRSVVWPRRMLKMASNAKEYDLVKLLYHQLTKFPHAGLNEDDLLDAQAYGEDLLRPLPQQKAASAAPTPPRPPADAAPRRSEVEAPKQGGRTAGRYLPELARKARADQDQGRRGRYMPGRKA